MNSQQHQILLELQTILQTCRSIDTDLTKTIELLEDPTAPVPYDLVVQENIDTIKQILQLLDSLEN